VLQRPSQRHTPRTQTGFTATHTGVRTATMGEQPNDWQCPSPYCVNHTRMVFGSKANCPKCGASRDDGEPVAPKQHASWDQYSQTPDLAGAESHVKAEKGMQGGDMPDDWQCPNTGCINNTKMVFGKRSSCPKCGTARNAKQPGDWQCPNIQCVNNKNTVFASKPMCPKCGAPRPGGGFAGAMNVSMPYVQQQTPRPSAMPFALNGGQYALPSQAWGMPGGGMCGSGAPGDWRCPNMDCINNRKMVFAKNATCPKCGTAREVVPTRVQGSVNPGDWECPDTNCLNHRNKVFAKHTHCPSCGQAKPEDGMDRARSRSPYDRSMVG